MARDNQAVTSVLDIQQVVVRNQPLSVDGDVLYGRLQRDGHAAIWTNDAAFAIDSSSATYAGGGNDLLHGWFPYLESYSPTFVEDILREFAPQAKVTLDPFAGIGTTPLTSARNGARGWYCEINPVLRFVITCKALMFSMTANDRQTLSERLFVAADEVSDGLDSTRPDPGLMSSYRAVFGDSVYFDDQELDSILSARAWVDGLATLNPKVGALTTLAALSSLLPASRLIRRGDVRYRTAPELLRIRPFVNNLQLALRAIATDVASFVSNGPAPVLIVQDARDLLLLPRMEADAVVTSPPYLNGTNYFRNTKLELWFTRQLRAPEDLARFRRQAITAGINDVTAGERPAVTASVQQVVAALSANAYDRRIPQMVRDYFADMWIVVQGVMRHVSPGGLIAVDIGDSNYGGINVPTHDIIAEIFEVAGARLERVIPLRARQPKSGKSLAQVVLVFRNPSASPPRVRSSRYALAWEDYKVRLPHTTGERAKRNWGHGRHSLCSYAGKMKPSLAEGLIRTFVPEKGRMLDPFAGVGTLPFEAALAGGTSFSFEISPAAFHIARAKLSNQDPKIVSEKVDSLLEFIDRGQPTESEYAAADQLAFNGPLRNYFHPQTFRELLLARRHLLDTRDDSPEHSLIVASMLHILHGNRPYALSRTSHPIVPFAPSGDVTYRPLAPRLQAKVTRVLSAPLPSTFVPGHVHWQDATNEWPLEIDDLDAVITSPPFFNSTRFHVQNWMRLWFAGWSKADFATLPRAFLDERQKTGFEVYDGIIRQARERLRPNGVLVFHLGFSRKSDMAQEIGERAHPWFDIVDRFDEEVANLERHGIRDKGTVTRHSYLVLA